MKSWAASFALHGVAIGLAALVWLEPRVEEAREPMRWQVAFTPAPVTPPAPEPARPAPPKQVAPPTPKPPPPVPTPQPPTPAPAPREAMAPQPPSVPQRVEPAVTAQASAEPVPVRTQLPVAEPAPAPVQARTETVDSAAEVERRWYLALLERLRAMKRYPLAARRLGQEGVVLIEARIGPDGRLEGAEIKRGSGYPLLDREALRLLETAAETARGQLRPERPTRLEIPIAYRLES
ncbi:MAG: TonB family protein [Gallionellaceae bacterium]|nr:TonB family protein [Gallionellaceae bacterium]MDD5365165.1 TonB family protein [Gallionellaceae bacterium]